MSRDEVAAIALEAVFMLHTGYGQTRDKQMPVSDVDTLVEFARLLKDNSTHEGIKAE